RRGPPTVAPDGRGGPVGDGGRPRTRDQCSPDRTSVSDRCQTGWSPAVSTLKPESNTSEPPMVPPRTVSRAAATLSTSAGTGVDGAAQNPTARPTNPASTAARRA